MTQVLVTRPQEASQELAGQLEAHGLEAVIMPFYTFQARSPDFEVGKAWLEGEESKVAVFTSPRAVTHGLAQVPRDRVPDGESLLGVEGCLCARGHGETWNAGFELDPDTCSRRLADQAGLAEITCRTINLEEMFIELAGRSS